MILLGKIDETGGVGQKVDERKCCGQKVEGLCFSDVDQEDGITMKLQTVSGEAKTNEEEVRSQFVMWI